MAVTWPLEKDAAAFYGHPGNLQNQSIADSNWLATQLVVVTPPFAMTFAEHRVPFIRIHTKCADSLRDVLGHIWELAGHDPDKIHAWGADVFGGSFNYRLKRTGNKLSMHAYGAAIDFDPVRNALGNPAGHITASSPIVQAFKKEGWEWGGDWHTTKDPMHFQAARTH